MKKIIFTFLLLSTYLFANSNKGETKTDAEEIIQIKTSFGDIYINLFRDTPIHRNNFLKLAREGVFDGTLFHRIIEGFMIQGGDVYSKMPEKKDSIGEGDPGYTLEAEINEKYFHKRGVIAAARNGDDVNPKRRSSGSQFYIVQGKRLTDEEINKYEIRVQNGTGNPSFKFTQEQRDYYKYLGGTPWLDRQYTIFGEVITGMSVVDKIAAKKKNENDRPVADIKMDVNVVMMTRESILKKYKYKI
jgi:cyclophilin family peptidyl-prolyl cis-trans isomerase